MLNNQMASQVSNMNEMNPSANVNACAITGVVKRSGKITGYQLSDGQQVSKQQGVNMAKQNQIKGVGIAVNQGTEYLRALPDGNQVNNLSNLPTIVS